MKLTFEVTLELQPVLDYLQVKTITDDLRKELISDIRNGAADYLSETNGLRITVLDVQLTGPAQAPVEAPQADPGWNALHSRTAGVLQRAGFRSPRAAYDRGEDFLIGNVDGFGFRMWQQLSTLFEG
jgi:hypothetical protein